MFVATVSLPAQRNNNHRHGWQMQWEKTSHNYAMWDFLIYNHCKLSLSWLRHISGAYIKIWNVRHAGTTNNSNVIVAWMTIVAIKSLTTIYLFVYSYPTYIGSGIVFLSSAFLFLHMLVWWQRDAYICTGLQKKTIFLPLICANATQPTVVCGDCFRACTANI